MLKNADFKPFYATGEDDEPSGFLFDGLANSQRFDLGLGYFRSTGFSCLALGFASFVKHGGSMRFIINDSLAYKDKGAILQGMQDLPDVAYEQTLLQDLELLTKTLTKRNKHFFNCLSWLIASGKLQMIAVVPKKNKVGIVHHKFGIFADETGDQAAFNGSVNFSQYALLYNVESIWCEYSWEAQGIARARIDEMVRLFENAWNGTSPAVRTIPLEQVKTAIKAKFPQKTYRELVEMECELVKEVIEFPGTSEKFKEKLQQMMARLRAEAAAPAKPETGPFKKWLHQEEAISLFLEKERGVLNMATGTGKTRAALRICETLIEKDLIDSIIISCDGTDLLRQWYRELLKLVTQGRLHWAIARQYGEFYENGTFRSDPFHKVLLSSRQKLHSVMGRFQTSVGRRVLLIHDEVHRLGSEGTRSRLNGSSESIRFRLGLSATPEREYDEEGTQFILDHIGPVIFGFSLEDAIRAGILAPFDYFPLAYAMTDGDRAALKQVYKRKSMLEKAGTPMSNEEFWMELARVYKTAEGKITVFHDFIDGRPEILDKCIIFVETKEYGERILEIVHRYNTDFHTYFGEDDASLLNRFSRGEIDCLLTCHRLSEGIDIRSIKNVILLSSARSRLETIQRIGRCLRIDPEQPNKIANIVDFIRLTDSDESGVANVDEERRAFLQHLSTIRL